jgi:hypothetical protein
MLKIEITLMIVSAVSVALFALVTQTQLPVIIAVNAQNMTSGRGTTAENVTATTITAQKTAISTVDSLPGHQMHQAVIVLPARTDGKIWVGTISWSASKPVEVRLLQNYDTSQTPDKDHGKPVTAPFGNGESAISLILASNGAATVPSYNAGSLNFAASQVAFHTLGGVPFTVTYTVDAVAKSLTE